MMGKLTGKTVFEACMRERLLNDIRGWDRREYTEQYKGSAWQCVSPGLTPAEKAKWERVASRLALSSQVTK